MPSALILIAHGTEEMEFTITYDTLVRAGISCTSAFVPESSSAAITGSTGNAPPLARCSRGMKIQPDVYFSLHDSSPAVFDALIIPGGAQGAETLSTSSAVQGLVREYIEKGKIVGMICAGSLTALTAGLPKQKLTSHPSVRFQLEKNFEYSEEAVVVSGTLVTSRGPGTTFPFAFAIVELLCGAAKRAEVRGPMVFPQDTPF